jgi:hypothetical protein
MFELTVLVPIIVAIVQAIKMAFNMDSKFAPLLSIVLGIAYVIVIGNLPLTEEIGIGILAGLSASGLYSSKVIFKK